MEVLVRKNVSVKGHRTSLRLESEIWAALDEICRIEGLTLHQLCTRIDGARDGLNRTSALRTFIVQYFREAATAEGHALAGHGRKFGDQSSAAGQGAAVYSPV